MTGSPALLLVGHGTRDPAGVRGFHLLVEEVAALSPVPVAAWVHRTVLPAAA